MSNNRNFKFPAFLLLIVALFAFGAVTAFASDDLGGGGGSFRPAVSADAQHVFTLNDELLSNLVAPNATLVLVYQPVDGTDSVDGFDLVTAAESLLNTEDVGAALGEWLLETESGTYQVRLVALTPAA
jgi:hypothetical protein